MTSAQVMPQSYLPMGAQDNTLMIDVSGTPMSQYYSDVGGPIAGNNIYTPPQYAQNQNQVTGTANGSFDFPNSGQTSQFPSGHMQDQRYSPNGVIDPRILAAGAVDNSMASYGAVANGGVANGVVDWNPVGNGQGGPYAPFQPAGKANFDGMMGLQAPEQNAATGYSAAKRKRGQEDDLGGSSSKRQA